MEAHLYRPNHMSYQQQFLNHNTRSNPTTTSSRTHYSNRQQPIAQHHQQQQQQQQPVQHLLAGQHHLATHTTSSATSSAAASDQEDRAAQLSSLNSSSSSTQKTTSSSQAAILGPTSQKANKSKSNNNNLSLSSQQMHHHQQQQQRQRLQQRAIHQSHTLASTASQQAYHNNSNNNKGGHHNGYLGHNGKLNADQLTSTSSASDQTTLGDDLQQLASSYGGGKQSSDLIKSRHLQHNHHHPLHQNHSQHRSFVHTNGGKHSQAALDRVSSLSISSDSQSGSRFLLGVLFTLAELLLFATVFLWLYWAYQHDDGLAWQNDRKQQFNTHAALMIFGLIFLTGQSMLIHRSFQCCSKIYTKILHTILFVLATSAISLGLIMAYNAQENVGPNNKPIMHFYSLHAWCGLTTVGLFALQFVFGFVSFLILLCCDQATSRYRAALLPIHKTFGLIIFSLAIATCLTGLLQTARSRLSSKLNKVDYHELAESGIVINLIGVCLICLAIIMPYIIRNLDIKRPFKSELDRHLNKLSHLDMRI